MKALNPTELLTESTCSFEMSKKAWENGINMVNTIMWYDEKGEAKIMGKIDYTVFQKDVLGSDTDMGVYPCISLPHAISMLGKTTLDLNKVLLFTLEEIAEEDVKPEKVYYFNYDGQVIGKNKNLVDLLVDIWITHKKAEP